MWEHHLGSLPWRWVCATSWKIVENDWFICELLPISIIILHHLRITCMMKWSAFLGGEWRKDKWQWVSIKASTCISTFYRMCVCQWERKEIRWLFFYLWCGQWDHTLCRVKSVFLVLWTPWEKSLEFVYHGGIDVASIDLMGRLSSPFNSKK